VSSLDRDRVPPYLPKQIGADTVAEATFEHDGDLITFRYRPAILLRAERTRNLGPDELWRWIRAALVEVIGDSARYGPFDPEVGADQRLSLRVRRAVPAVLSPWLGHCMRWARDWMEQHREAVDRAQLRYERGQGLR
jgi:hypothetical protein